MLNNMNLSMEVKFDTSTYTVLILNPVNPGSHKIITYMVWNNEEYCTNWIVPTIKFTFFC